MKNTTIFILLGVVALGAIGYSITNKKSPDSSAIENKVMDQAMNKDLMMDDKKMEGDTMMKKEDAMMKDGVMEKEAMMKGETMQKDAMAKDTMVKDAMMVKSGTYETYSAAKVSAATGKTVLFFNASWCPSCRTADADIKANLSKIPSGTQILSVDYDTSADLKKKYGVTSQHTFVQVDNAGNKIHSWSGGDLNKIISTIK